MWFSWILWLDVCVVFPFSDWVFATCDQANGHADDGMKLTHSFGRFGIRFKT